MTNEEISFEKINDLIDDCNDGKYIKGTDCDCAQYPCRLHVIKNTILENTKLKAEKEELELENVCANHVIDKLKAEIEQLKERLEIKDNNFELYSNALEEIEQLNGIISRDMDKHECYVISKSIEVNNLKIEIKQLKSELEQWQSTNLKLVCELTRIECENNQLKSEFEQSVIQCTHGYDKRQNEIGETLIFCEHTDNWMNVTLGECIGNCEAEERSGIK